MSSNSNTTGKFEPPRLSSSNVNPLLGAAASGLPFEIEESSLLVPVCLTESPAPELEESKSESEFQDCTDTPQPPLPPLTTAADSPSTVTSPPPPPSQSYSSKLASYFPGVTTAFSNLTHTITGQSPASYPPQTTPSPALGSTSSLSPSDPHPPQRNSTFYTPPPPSLFNPLPPKSTSPAFTPSAPPVRAFPPPPPKSSDAFASVPLTASLGHQATPPFVQNAGNSSFFVPSSVSPPSPLTLPSPLGGASVPLYPAPTTPLSPPLTSSVPTEQAPSAASGYRLKGLKRPTYAPVPGLGTTPVAPMAPTVTPSPSSDLSDYMIVESDIAPGYEACAPASPPGESSTEIYREVYHHWFFKKIAENKGIWHPLSMPDSQRIEEAFRDPSQSQVVPSDGGRYDVSIPERQRKAVYWKENATEVRRCSWFYKASLESRYIPYDEAVADVLEREYREAVQSNQWHKTIPLDNGEEVIMYSMKVIVHHIKPDLRLTDFAWDSSSEQSIKPRIVSRGLEMFDISEGEPEKIDHLLFLVHGIGSFCDLKFRPVVEVVDDFRSISLQLTSSHFKSATDLGTLGRVEMLPISWHEALHSEESGIDKKLKAITLPSIPKLRYFTNDTLLDVLFYTSPVYCERIITAVCKEMNRIYSLFRARNPSFEGGVSMGGHSLGSLILFDLLSHQKAVTCLNSNDVKESTDTDDEACEHPATMQGKSRLTKAPSYMSIPSEGTSAPLIKYPQLSFQPRIFFAFGSPTGMFVNVRGIDSLGEDFVFPTCPKFYNIFHPFDPVAYRIEPLIVPAMEHVRPVLIPHHKGRKRMHLELKDTLEYVGTALKQKLYDSMKSTWNKVSYLATLNKAVDSATVTQEVTQALEDQLLAESAGSYTEEPTQDLEPGKTVGKINQGNRVDFVLQEAPLESFNEYLFALSSHVCYWESNDTMLLVLKEIYADMGFSADSQVPQQILPFDMDETGGPVEVASPPGSGMHPGSVLGAHPLPNTQYM